MRAMGMMALMALMAGCSRYTEEATHYEDGRLNHTMKVTHTTFLLMGKAARLTTETQTEEFIRSVNAEGIEARPDAQTAGAVAAGVTRGLTRL